MPSTQSVDLRWVCWDCPRTYKSEKGALAHCEDHDHWLGLHPHGDRGRPATKTMHASDYGGCYVDDYPARLAERQAREYRDRQPGGVF